MAYWLLVSTLLYLLASLTRLPAAVRAVGWATLPLVRRVADHAVAVTLATSMVGGGTLGVASPALAADRGRAGPPARKPVAAAQAAVAAQDDATSTTLYRPKVAGAPGDADQAGEDESGSTGSSTSTTPSSQATSSSGSTSTTEETTTTAPTTTTTTAPTTTTTTRETTTTGRETTTTAGSKAPPPAYVPAPASRATTTTAPTTTAPPSSTTSTTGLRPPAYRFPAAGTSPAPKPPPSGGQPAEPNPSGEPGTGGESTPPKAEKETSHEVAGGENLWTIAQNRLEEAAAGGSGEPTTAEVTQYWERVKEANQGRLESGDPDVIEVGATIILPPVPSTARPAPERRGETTKPAGPGDSLWTLARDHLAAVGNGGEPSTRQVTEYWERVKDANRHRLRSGDPDLIEIGEPITLPPLD